MQHDLRSEFTHNFLWGKDEERHRAWVTATLSDVWNGLLLLDSLNPTVNLPLHRDSNWYANKAWVICFMDPLFLDNLFLCFGIYFWSLQSVSSTNTLKELFQTLFTWIYQNFSCFISFVINIFILNLNTILCARC